MLAKYSGDGSIYRARVEAVDGKNATVGWVNFNQTNNSDNDSICFRQVFYVDYGNTEFVTFDALFEWDTMCNVLPFQAILCKLANIQGIAGSASQAVQDFIYNNYLEKQCQIFVL